MPDGARPAASFTALSEALTEVAPEPPPDDLKDDPGLPPTPVRTSAGRPTRPPSREPPSRCTSGWRLLHSSEGSAPGREKQRAVRPGCAPRAKRTEGMRSVSGKNRAVVACNKGRWQQDGRKWRFCRNFGPRWAVGLQQRRPRSIVTLAGQSFKRGRNLQTPGRGQDTPSNSVVAGFPLPPAPRLRGAGRLHPSRQDKLH
jgi:hypothetical protein